MLIRDLASTPAVTCRPSASLQQVARMLSETGTGCVVVTGDDGRAVGICTDRDIVTRGVAAGRPLETPVESVMSRGVVVVRGDADAHQADELIGTWGYRRLPVVNDDGWVLGVVSIDDLAIQLSSDAGRLLDALRASRH